ncbi:MAG: AAA family ATPase [Planctomycetes bacterium]|nr:AAA family ATPase [Planctomycetota bacterium]MCB9870097.1 AAA family ATPase [Planctomycetota bacterium]
MSDLPAALRDPAAYPHRPARVEWLQTHISWLFFADHLVYKVKKPVELGFLDFRSIDARRHYCAEEVRLNAALAPGVYRRVVPIRSDGGAVRVGEGPGETVDWAVEMERLPAEGMLDRLLDAGDLDNARMREIARVIAEFHAAAATGPGVDEHGAFAAVRQNCVDNFTETEHLAGSAVLSERLHDFLRGRAMAFLDDRRQLFERRVLGGRIREGHGDLHAGNICLVEQRVVVYDRIEFSARFRCGDVAADLAFLLMDLDLRCFRAFSGFLQHDYVARTADHELGELVPFYKSYRAYVRAKVNALGLAALHPIERAEAEARVRGYFHLAASYEVPPALILCCGLPGSGKSYLAPFLARPFEAVLLNSDRARKRAAGQPAASHREEALGEGIYTEDRSEGVYADLLARAEALVAEGRTVVVDAGFRTRERRQPFAAMAQRVGVRLVVVHADPPESVILERLEAREAGNASASDAGIGVYRGLKDEFEPPDEFGGDVVRFEGSVHPSVATAGVIDRLV